MRADIQGLRALAVGAVLAYHLWPGRLTGGYVGVDVFLVISGYLITAHLLRDPPTTWGGVGRFWGRRVRRLLPASALVISGYLITAHLLRDPPTTWAGVGRFWGRRVRRLLPASALVLVTTVGAAALVLPSTLLRTTGAEAVSSALYVQNWALARTATDYLAAAGEATAFRHYWSLSVEEQYYLVWPLLVGGATVLGVWWAARSAARAGAWTASRRAPRALAGPRTVLSIVLAVVLLASLAWSVHLTAVNPAAAYYVTTTRLWELAVGGAVALVEPVLRLRAGSRTPLAAVGLLAVIAAVVRFDETTAFPGAWALLPTLGTAVVLLVAPPARGVVGRMLGWRPAQVLGDVSYSTYLWHWPLIALVPFTSDGELGWAGRVGIAVASVGLAMLTKRFVEDPVRRSPRLNRSSAATAGVLLVCTAFGVGAGLSLQGVAAARERGEATAVARAAAEHPDCFGAAAELSGADCSAWADALWTPPAFAAADKPQVYADHCWNEQPYTSRTSCTYGPSDAAVSIALVGNSHAGHWFPALEQVATERGWRITTYLTSVCYPVDVPLSFTDPASSAGCSEWTAWMEQQVGAQGYDLVLASARTDQPLAGVRAADQDAAAQAAYARTIDAFTAAGAAVLVLRDTPNMGRSVPDCVATSPDGAQGCAVPRATGLEVDPLALAAAADGSGKVGVLDVTDLLCAQASCRAVIGGAIVYFDHGHMTATFARSLAPRVATAVDGVLGT